MDTEDTSAGTSLARSALFGLTALLLSCSGFEPTSSTSSAAAGQDVERPAARSASREGAQSPPAEPRAAGDEEEAPADDSSRGEGGPRSATPAPEEGAGEAAEDVAGLGSELPAPTLGPPPGHLEECFEGLRRAGVPHRRVEVEDLSSALVELRGPLEGIEVRFVGRRRVHTYLDCRLVWALRRYAPILRAGGVSGIRHLSVYRPNATVAGTEERSGHASGLAIDLRFLELDDGRSLDVLEDWGDATRGGSPCEVEEMGELRRLICAAVEHDLFEVIITPHHDPAHRNHVHLEVVPSADYRFIH